METGRQCLLRTSTLPNGLTVHCVSREDVSFIYDEVFLQRGYLQHDVQLRPGDTVVDIGVAATLTFDKWLRCLLRWRKCSMTYKTILFRRQG